MIYLFFIVTNSRHSSNKPGRFEKIVYLGYSICGTLDYQRNTLLLKKVACMNTKSGFIFLALITSLTTALMGSMEKKLMVGSIQFPKAVQCLEGIRIWCGGKKIKSETDTEGKKVTFSLTTNKYQNYFYMLITEHPGSQMAEDNTIQYLKSHPHHAYKFYSLELLADATWRIKELKTSLETGRIPDDTIIVYYNPDYIEKVNGGNQIELPKIFLKNDIIALAGSEDRLHDQSIELLLSSLDFDTLHDTIKQTVKQDISLKTIVALDL